MANKTQGMTLIVKTVTRLTVGLILIYGLYIALQGPKTPGGGFAGGVIIALSLIHVMLAFGKEKALAVLDTSRSVVLASCAGLGLLWISALFMFNVSIKGWTMLTMLECADIFIAILVGAGLFAAFVLLICYSRKTQINGETR
jgi:multisubunit Na+/H+ antiporter MnhB subunit